MSAQESSTEWWTDAPRPRKRCSSPYGPPTGRVSNALLVSAETNTVVKPSAVRILSRSYTAHAICGDDLLCLNPACCTATPDECPSVTRNMFDGTAAVDGERCHRGRRESPMFSCMVMLQQINESGSRPCSDADGQSCAVDSRVATPCA